MESNEADQNRVRKRLKLPPFVQNKMFLIAAGAILFIAVAGGVFSILFLGERAAEDQAAMEEESEAVNDEPERAEVLPQQRRENESSSGSEANSTGGDDVIVTFNPSIDPFADPMRLTGTASGARGGDMAIIESSGTSYIVSENDYVDDLWSVREVRPDQVILRAHDKEVTLYLDKPPQTRSLVPDQDDEDQEEGE